MFSPYLMIGALVGSLALAGGAYVKGRADANANCNVRVQTMIAEAQVAKDAEAAKAAGVSTVLETQNTEARVVFRTITRTVDKIVDREVYRNICLDSDGLALANAALAGVDVILPAPLPAVPTP